MPVEQVIPTSGQVNPNTKSKHKINKCENELL